MNIISRKKLNILIQLAEADGDFHPLEYSFILKVAQRHGISEAEIERLRDEQETIGSLGALSYENSRDYLTDALLLLPVDGKILQSEIVFCQDIALRLGFLKSGVDKLINRLKHDKALDEERLKKLIRIIPHMNKPVAF